MRALGLDVGDRRIGLASGDTETGLAIPAGAIERTTPEADIEAIIREARDRDAGVIVAGIPYTMRGTEGPQAAATRVTIEALRAAGMPVETVDERLSTVEAERRMVEGRNGGRGRGRAPRNPKGASDAAAAAVILQSWLDSHR